MTEGNGLSLNKSIHISTHRLLNASGGHWAKNVLQIRILQIRLSCGLVWCFFWVCAQMKRHKYCSASPWRVAKLVYGPIGSQCTWIPVLLIFPFLEKILLVIGVKFEMHTPPLSSLIYNTLMASNCITCFYAPFLFLEYVRFMLQIIFVSEKCERRGTCENRQLFQHAYTFELKQKNVSYSLQWLPCFLEV